MKSCTVIQSDLKVCQFIHSETALQCKPAYSNWRQLRDFLHEAAFGLKEKDTLEVNADSKMWNSLGSLEFTELYRWDKIFISLPMSWKMLSFLKSLLYPAPP